MSFIVLSWALLLFFSDHCSCLQGLHLSLLQDSGHIHYFFIFRYLSIAITCGPSSVWLVVGNPLNLCKMLHCPLVEENGNFLPITTCCSLRIPIWWNWIIFHGTPDDFSWHTSVGLHSGLEMLCYNIICGQTVVSNKTRLRCLNDGEVLLLGSKCIEKISFRSLHHQPVLKENLGSFP